MPFTGDQMEESDYTPPDHKAHGGIRNRISAFVNAQLSRMGYVIVRIDGTSSGSTRAIGSNTYAYTNLHLLEIYSPWMSDESFLHIWRTASQKTLTDIFRSYELYECVREVATIPGDILEVGVWRGGTGAVLAAAAQKWKPNAKVWLCDTFSGVVKAGEYDNLYRGGEHADASQEAVASLMTRLQLTNTSILTGIFPEETAMALVDTRIALCHIDVDVYQSAADIVAWLKPRMSSGSMLVFDDYGFSSCKGITKFVDELRTCGDWIYVYNLNKHAVLIRR
jgi:O-methyltransferase